MAKKKINYQNTEIYKIVCNDTPEFYVGSTTDFISRKSHHKSRCNNEKNKNYNLKIYKTIREYGGWDNWRMVLVEKFPCENRREAEKREEEIRVELNATLNTKRAWSDGKCFVEECDNYPKKDGLCVKHGAVLKRCSVQDCDNYPQKGGLCVKHGAVLKRCSVQDCDNYPQKDGLCMKHSPQYACEVCNKLVKSSNKTRHEKTKLHLNNLNKV